MSHTEDKWRVQECKDSYKLVTEWGSPIKRTIECLTIQRDNTRWMQAYSEERLAKRERNAKGKKYTDAMNKAVEAEKKSIQFFIDHRVKIRAKIAELKAQPELERKRLIAFAMGHQKRLGAASHIAHLHPELVRMIIEGV
jgi:hypothetical protein